MSLSDYTPSSTTVKWALGGLLGIAVIGVGGYLYREWRQDMKELKDKSRNKKPRKGGKGKKDKTKVKEKKAQEEACSKSALMRILGKEVQAVQELRGAILQMIQVARQRSPNAQPEEILKFISQQFSTVMKVMRPKLLQEEGVTNGSLQAGLEAHGEDEEVQRLLIEKDDIINDMRQGGIDLDTDDTAEVEDFPEDLTIEKFIPIYTAVMKKSAEAVDTVIKEIEKEKDLPAEQREELALRRLTELADIEAKKIFKEHDIKESHFNEGVRRYQTHPDFYTTTLKANMYQKQQVDKLQIAIHGKTLAESRGDFL